MFVILLKWTDCSPVPALCSAAPLDKLGGSEICSTNTFI